MNSNLTAVNYNYFLRCAKVTTPPRCGYGIYAQNQNATAVTLNVGTNGAYPQNNFEYNTNGMFIGGRTTTSIYANRFLGTTQNCIYSAANHNASWMLIDGNEFYGGNTQTGIFWWNNQNTPTSITNNKFESIINSIVLADNNTGTTMNVQQNDIWGGRYGIQSLNLNNAVINYNFVKFNPSSYNGMEKVGILIANNDGTTANQNFIDGNSSGTSVPANVRGIGVVSSINTTLQCDSMIRCEWAIRGQGNSYPTALRSNAMRDCTAGVVLDGQGAQFGGQLWLAAPPFGLSTNDNKWWGNMGAHFLLGHTRAVNGANGTLTTFYFRNPNPAPEFFPSPFRNFKDLNALSIPTIVTIWNNVPYPLIGCNNNYNTNIVAGGGNEQNNLEKMAKGEVEYTADVEPYLQQWDNEQLYKWLDANQDIRANSAVLDSFFAANRAGALGDLSDARIAASRATNEAERQTALQKVDALVAGNLSEINTKEVQRLYLEYKHRGLDSVASQEVVKLRNIAQQCFVFGGASVFVARAMYYAATGEVDNSFTDYCLENINAYKTESANASYPVSPLIKIYPNPLSAQHNLIVESNIEAESNLTNSIGQKVLQTRIEKGINNLRIDNLSAGVYYLVVDTESEQRLIERIVIR